MAVTAMVAISFGQQATSAELTFETPREQAIAIDAPSTTGLEKVYVLATAEGVRAKFTADSPAAAMTVRWKRFGMLGGGYAEDVASSVSGRESYIDLSAIISESGMGYIVESAGRQYCFWIVNYAAQPCTLGNLTIDREQSECDRTALHFEGSAPRIIYYSINGVGQTLSRQMEVTYNSLVFNEEAQLWEQTAITESLDYADETVRVPAALCQTEYTLHNDRFQRQWGHDAEVSTQSEMPKTIGVRTSAKQTSRSNDNEQREEGSVLGGSGPVEITFTAEVTDAVIFREWQFATDREFDIIDLRIQENEVRHTFRDYGHTYVRFVAGNDDNTCTYYSEVYEVYIGESRLLCPNAFSPYGSEGVNDEWKVSYKSIIDFDCHIFNRWGQEMIHLTDPSQGWDGRYKGKLVPAGVYYYVIRATGTDGQEYKLSGDINILKYEDKRGYSNNPVAPAKANL